MQFRRLHPVHRRPDLSSSFLYAAAYKKLLGQIDASLARDVAQVMKAVLEKVRGPADYNGHPAVLAAFDVFPSNMIQNGLEAATTKTACGLPRPTTVRLYQAKNGIRTSIVQLTTSVNKAVGRGAQFGANMTPPALKAPPLMNARATNGQVIQRSGPRGSSTLQMSNMSGMDAVVVVTPSDPSSRRCRST